jgi:tetratricopeptide (TPR) repeat protein
VRSDSNAASRVGRYYLSSPTEERVRKALEQFEQAIRMDPNFAPAYSGIADAYILGESLYFPPNEVMPKAKAAAEKAVSLDDMLAEAHFSLGAAKFQYDYDWLGAENEIRRAIALNPSYAYGHDQYGFYLALRGRLDDAVAESRIATELNPLSPLAATDMVFPLTWQTKYAEAKEQCRNALALDPNNWWVNGLSGGSTSRLGSSMKPSWNCRRPGLWILHLSSRVGSDMLTQSQANAPRPRPQSQS